MEIVNISIEVISHIDAKGAKDRDVALAVYHVESVLYRSEEKIDKYKSITIRCKGIVNKA